MLQFFIINGCIGMTRGMPDFSDLCAQCCYRSDNIPSCWIIYYSKSNKDKRYVNTNKHKDDSWITFKNQNIMKEYGDIFYEKLLYSRK